MYCTSNKTNKAIKIFPAWSKWLLLTIFSFSHFNNLKLHWKECFLFIHFVFKSVTERNDYLSHVYSSSNRKFPIQKTYTSIQGGKKNHWKRKGIKQCRSSKLELNAVVHTLNLRTPKKGRESSWAKRLAGSIQ